NVLSVFAKTDPTKGVEGISAFIVEKGTPGLSIGKREKKMGNKALNSCEVIFEDCRVPRENLMRGEGQGWLIAMETLDKTRPMVAAVGVGLAQGALDYAVQYSKERVQFGKPTASFQAIQFKLADMAIEIEAARQLTYAAAAYIDEATSQPGWQKNKPLRARMTMLGSMCKCYATDVAMRTAIEAAQVLGGYGYMQDYPMERHIRDAKLLQIVEGTNEIQRTVISKLLLG
ncbi:MAG: acyl-CoA dehydrogenase, partial [Candidatus Tectomicrobia bacterium]|nr:acyl-CoA dehydrogenase [Candidatus Tectomicrobia bacterium]